MADVEIIAVPALSRPPGPIRHAWRRPTLTLGAAMLALLALTALLAPVIAQHDPLQLTPAVRLKPPGEAHLFGTDMLGRDLFARTLHGGRTSLLVGLATALVTSLAGLAIGLVAGFSRLADGLIMRVMDGLMAIPGILLAIALATIMGGGLVTIIVAIMVPEVPVMVRLIRSVVLSIREQPYIDAARAVATPPWRILLGHVVPNALAPVLVQATFVCGLAILVEAYLSFLGAGIPSEIPSWGNVMAEGRTFFLVAPWLMLIPGAFVAATVLSLNLMGDALRDLLDPRGRRA